MALQMISERVVEQTEKPAAPSKANGIALGLIIQSLQVLSKRTLIAIASIFDLALCSSVFYLMLSIGTEPSLLQLYAIGGYAFFVLLVLMFRKNIDKEQ